MTGISHLAIGVRDLARSAAFYRERLGLSVLYDGSADPTPNLKGLLGTLMIELEQRSHALPASPPSTAIIPALTVADIDAHFSALGDVRIDDTAAPDEMMGVRFFSVSDPDGHRIELISFPAGQRDLGSYLQTLIRKRAQ